jgi:hypothetical protein
VGDFEVAIRAFSMIIDFFKKNPSAIAEIIGTNPTKNTIPNNDFLLSGRG